MLEEVESMVIVPKESSALHWEDTHMETGFQLQLCAYYNSIQSYQGGHIEPSVGEGYEGDHYILRLLHVPTGSLNCWHTNLHSNSSSCD